MENKQAIVQRLKQDILRLQGYTDPETQNEYLGLGPIEKAFPNQVFPKGSVHEFVFENREQNAATCGFIEGLLSHLMERGGVCVWIDTFRTLFPPAARSFGVEPAHIVFVQMPGQRQALWAVEEALKCKSLSVVVAELYDLNFVQSRRLQLAVEESKVTGVIIHPKSRAIGTTSCAARWQVRSLPSKLDAGVPGIGYPRWEVELLKVRNGNPGCWQLEWSEKGFSFGKQAPDKNILSGPHIQTG